MTRLYYTYFSKMALWFAPTVENSLTFHKNPKYIFGQKFLVANRHRYLKRPKTLSKSKNSRSYPKPFQSQIFHRTENKEDVCHIRVHNNYCPLGPFV